MSTPTQMPAPPDEEPRRFFAREIVSGGTETAAPEEAAPTPGTMALGALLWLGGLGLLAAIDLWMFAIAVGIIISIVLHEFGHYYTARKSGMKVTQFFVGMGPRVWSTHRDGIEYGLRILPVGGFVKIVGMTNVDEVDPADEPYTYRQGTYARRMWVITAGSVMHMVLALVLITSAYVAWGTYEESGRVTIYGVVDDSPAAAAGIEEGDIIQSVDGVAITKADQFRKVLAATAPGTEVELSVLRDGSTLSLTAVLAQSASAPEGEVRGFLGVSSDSNERAKQPLGEALLAGPRDLAVGVGQSVVGIVKVINPVNVWGHLVGSNDDPGSRPGTVVGATAIGADVGKWDGWAGILTLLALINVSVGVFNMFPLLPLDGGHAAIATYERFRSRRGKRYYADINKLMPVAVACITLLAFMFLTGLYLDTVGG